VSGPADSVRAFLAVPLSDAVRASLAVAVGELRSASWAGAIRWVAPESLHLTLRFLGAVTPDVVTAVRTRINEVASRHVAHRVSVTALATLPNARRPRVVVVELEPARPLVDLAADLERIAVAAGLAPEPRRFRPHVTLGRVRGRVPEGIRLAAARPDFELDVDAIALYRSTLLRGGARYDELARVPLATDASARS